MGSPVERTVLVSNAGDAPFTLVQLGFRYPSGSVSAGEFTYSVVGTQPTLVAPGAQFAVRVIHTPVDATPDRAFFTIVTTGAVPDRVELELLAEFKGNPTLTVHTQPGSTGASVTQLPMGQTNVGEPVTARLFVKNTGASNSALDVTSITLEPPSTTVFSVRAGPLPRAITVFPGTCASAAGCPEAAPSCVDDLCRVGSGSGSYPLDAVEVEVTFNPSEAGEVTADVVIQATGRGVSHTHRVTLAGLGQAGVLVATPSPFSFGDVFLNRTRTLDLTLANAGTGPVRITGMAWVGGSPEFVSDLTGLTFPYTVGAGGTVQVPVAFTPTVVGAVADILRVTLASGSLEVLVRGSGIREPELSTADSLDFGPLYVGLSKVLTLTLANVAAGELVVNRLYVEAAGTTPFTFTPTQVTAPITPALPVDLSVTYAPQVLTPGVPDTAVLVVESNDPDLPVKRVTLTGSTIRPVVHVLPSPPVLAFGAVLVGTSPSPTRTVTLNNHGYGPLLVTGPLEVVEGGGTVVPQFVVTADRGQADQALSATIPDTRDQAITLTITFTPTASAAQLAGVIRITTTDFATPAVDIQVSGGGEGCPPRANATSSVVEGGCVYTCVEGHHACGDACMSNTSPDSCGTSCTPCVARANADRTCVDGGCVYACQNPYYDLTTPRDLNLPQGSVSNGCEYRCDVSTPGEESCDGLDNDCDGSTDEGMPADNPDPPATCNAATATDLGDINDTGPGAPPITTTINTYTIYPNGDSDWFKFRAHEISSCPIGSCTPWPFANDEQRYRTTVKLEGIPQGVDYDLSVYLDSCSGQNATSSNGGNTSEQVSITSSGLCGIEDNFMVYVRVFAYPPGTGAGSCRPYTLKLTHEKLNCGPDG
jgi:hypothetical protein